MFKLFARLLNIFFGCVLFCIIVGLILLYEYTKNLPSYEQIIDYKPDLSINVFDDNGEYLGALYRENRILLTTENIPILMKQAIISAEDKDFYSNSGIDVNGIIRSVFVNIYNHITGENRLVGGSTITQQIVKNIMLSPQKTLKRKVQEARLALGVSKYLSKDEILERYINHIYLGNNTYGFAAAALGYFSKSLDELEIHEAAMLAALPQAPSRYDPVRKENHDHLFARRNWIISQMQKLGYISQEQADQASQKPIVLERIQLITQKPLGIEYVMDEVKKKLVNLCNNDESLIYQYGFAVKTTIDTRIQELATFALRKGLLEYEKTRYNWKGPIDNFKTAEEYFKFLNNFNYISVYPLKPAYVVHKEGNSKLLAYLKNKDHQIEIKETNQKIFKNIKVGDVVLVFPDLDQATFNIYQEPRVNGAIAIIDTNSGNVLGMAGGFNYYANQFNRTTQALRQPGSAFKPLVYLSAIEKGYTPLSIVMDEPISLPAGNGKMWTPKNHDNNFLGPLTMQSALARSRNLCTLYIARSIGLKNIIQTCKRLGLFPEDYNLMNYSIILGSQEVSLLNILRIYAIIANGGFDIQTNLIDYIKDYQGNLVWTRENYQCNNCTLKSNNELDLVAGGINPIPPFIHDQRDRLIDAKHDYYLLSMMKAVITNGTGRGLAYLGGNIAGKSGTSNEAKDIWFLGMTNSITFGIFIGFDQPKSLGNRAFGANTAIPIIKYFLDNAAKENLLGHEEEFDIIKKYNSKSDQFNEIDSYYGKSVDQNDAEDVQQNDGFEIIEESVDSSSDLSAKISLESLDVEKVPNDSSNREKDNSSSDFTSKNSRSTNLDAHKTKRENGFEIIYDD